MAKKVTRKELLREEDEFTTFSGRAILFFKEHSRQLNYVMIGVAVVALIYAAFNFFMGRTNKKGQVAYNQAFYSLTQSIVSGTTEVPVQAEEEFQRVLDDFGLSKVSRLARPQLARIKFQKGEYDEAISLYQEFSKDASDKPLYQSLARLGLAACYEAKDEYDRAIEILTEVTNNPDTTFREQAMLDLARIYRLSGQEDKSKEILSAFVEDYKNSPFLPLAKAFLN
jgi:predicted negative regulator of RcsB-dependent stress response